MTCIVQVDVNYQLAASFQSVAARWWNSLERVQSYLQAAGGSFATTKGTRMDELKNLTKKHQEALDRFVQFWGEMASRWGINRTMAQIHALLYASEAPLDTDEIMERLSISRGNANMNLRSLIDWKLVYKVQRSGSRKDYYEAEKDVWHITAQIIKRREREELEPVMKELRACRDLLPSRKVASGAEQQFGKRIENLMELIEVFDGVTTSLLPFIQQKNAPIIRHLIEIADSLGASDRTTGPAE